MTNQGIMQRVTKDIDKKNYQYESMRKKAHKEYYSFVTDLEEENLKED